MGNSTVRYPLHAMRKIHKEGKWVPHKFSKLIIQNHLIISASLLSRHKEKQFLYHIITSEKKNGSTMITSNVKILGRSRPIIDFKRDIHESKIVHLVGHGRRRVL